MWNHIQVKYYSELTLRDKLPITQLAQHISVWSKHNISKTPQFLFVPFAKIMPPSNQDNLHKNAS